MFECSGCGNFFSYGFEPNDKDINVMLTSTLQRKCSCGGKIEIIGANLTEEEKEELWIKRSNFYYRDDFYCYIFVCPNCENFIQQRIYEKKEPLFCNKCNQKTSLYKTCKNSSEASEISKFLLDKYNLKNCKKNKNNCFITTSVCKTLRKGDSCIELKQFRKFRDTYMQINLQMKSDVIEYYQIAPKICNEIEKMGEEIAKIKYFMIWESSLKPAFNALCCENYDLAYKLYKTMVLGLKEEYKIK